MQHIRVERELMLQMATIHPNIVQVYDVLESPDFVFIVMELCADGQFFDLIVARDRMQSAEARLYFRQIVSAVAYCHKVRFPTPFSECLTHL